MLHYFGEFSDLELVKEHLALGQVRGMEQKEAELVGVSRALDDRDGQFLQHLDLLKGGCSTRLGSSRPIAPTYISQRSRYASNEGWRLQQWSSLPLKISNLVCIQPLVSFLRLTPRRRESVLTKDNIFHCHPHLSRTGIETNTTNSS